MTSLLFALVLTSACAKPLSKQEFLKQGNALCAAYGPKVGAIAADIAGPAGRKPGFVPTHQQLVKLVTRVSPLYDKLQSDLRALRPPTADRARVKKMLDLDRAAFDATKKDPSLVPLAMQGAPGDPFKQAHHLEGQYGLTACGSDG
jgi:hypothetical protein